MRHTAIAAMLILGAASIYGDESRVRMTFSGTSETAATNLQQPNTSNDEDHFAGDGTLGKFSLHQIRAVSNSPDPTQTCPAGSQIPFSEPSGAGVFRFEDGSLLEVTLEKGLDCIDPAAKQALCTIRFTISGGTRRFKHASGTLIFTEVARPVLFDALGNPVFFDATGEFTGTIAGVAGQQHEHEDNR